MRTCGASHFIAVIVPLENFVSVPSRLDWTGPARGRGGGNAAVLPQYSVSLLYLLEPFNFDINMNEKDNSGMTSFNLASEYSKLR